ncbi:unnamed protein product [Amoebophrya sp. A25]|nr:unnamed protein product [Amoebophrya sp. A25]|eukprot:GSA25T00021578001.1
MDFFSDFQQRRVSMAKLLNSRGLASFPDETAREMQRSDYRGCVHHCQPDGSGDSPDSLRRVMKNARMSSSEIREQFGVDASSLVYPLGNMNISSEQEQQSGPSGSGLNTEHQVNHLKPVPGCSSVARVVSGRKFFCSLNAAPHPTQVRMEVHFADNLQSLSEAALAVYYAMSSPEEETVLQFSSLNKTAGNRETPSKALPDRHAPAQITVAAGQTNLAFKPKRRIKLRLVLDENEPLAVEQGTALPGSSRAFSSATPSKRNSIGNAGRGGGQQDMTANAGTSNSKISLAGQPLHVFLIDGEHNAVPGSQYEVWENEIMFRPPDAGVFDLHVWLGGLPIANSPLHLHVAIGDVHVAHCSCTLRPYSRLPVRSWAASSAGGNIVVTCRDECGNLAELANVFAGSSVGRNRDEGPGLRIVEEVAGANRREIDLAQLAAHRDALVEEEVHDARTDADYRSGRSMTSPAASEDCFVVSPIGLGVYRVSLLFRTQGRRKVRVLLSAAVGQPFSVLAEACVDVTAGVPHGPACELSLTMPAARPFVGVPFSASLILRDVSVSWTDVYVDRESPARVILRGPIYLQEAEEDAAEHQKVKKVVPQLYMAQITRHPAVIGGNNYGLERRRSTASGRSVVPAALSSTSSSRYASYYRLPEKENATLEVCFPELQHAGEYEVLLLAPDDFGTTAKETALLEFDLAGNDRFLGKVCDVAVAAGPPDPMRCSLMGHESGIFSVGISRTLCLQLRDAFDNPCILGASTAEVIVELYPEMVTLCLGREATMEFSEDTGEYILRTGELPRAGVYHVLCAVDGQRVLGSPFVMQLDEEPSVQVASADEGGTRERPAVDEGVAASPPQEDVVPLQPSAEEPPRPSAEKVAIVRARALERLRKTQNELRQRIKREKTKKEKRVGGGFLVQFDTRK